MSFLNPIDLSILHKHEWVMKIDRQMDEFLKPDRKSYDFERAAKVHGQAGVDAQAVILSTGVNGEHFYIEKHFQELVLAAATTCPDDAHLDHQMILTPYGWTEFADLIDIPSDDNTMFSFHSMAWFATENKVLFVCFSKTPHMDNLIFCASASYTMDMNKPYLKLFYSLMYLMGTKIAAMHREKTDRPKVQKVARASKTLREVNVVVLRRAYQQGEPTGQHYNRDYQFQWTVAPHWRKQPYKSTGEVRTILIDEYLKGPPDKPVKMRNTIFVARR